MDFTSHRLLSELPGLVDPYDLEYECDDPSIARATGTCNNANNSYSNHKSTEKNPEGTRIDHILFNLKPNWEVSERNT